MLPGLDGHKVCRMIKFDRKLSRIPVIVLTSRDLDQDAELAKQCGADAFILKTTKAPIRHRSDPQTCWTEGRRRPGAAGMIQAPEITGHHTGQLKSV